MIIYTCKMKMHAISLEISDNAANALISKHTHTDIYIVEK